MYFNSITTGDNSEAGIAYLSGAAQIYWSSWCSICAVFCRSLSFFLLIVVSVLQFTAPDYHFVIFNLRFLITALSSSIYGSWLPRCYLQFTAPGYHFVIFNLRLLITTLLSSIYGSWLPLYYLQFTAHYYHFVIFNLRFLITTLLSSNLSCKQ
jgi:hypothetical protein